MILELSLFGFVTGIVSGFFGVGGGMVLVPLLLYSGYLMKEAVAISIMQMVFSSLYGSYLNYKKNNTLLKDGLTVGFGGFLGGFLNSFVHQIVSNQFLEILFIVIVFFSIYRISMSSAYGSADKKFQNYPLLFITGIVIGMIAMSIGVGGAVMLTPILVGYMYYNLKDASSLGLFFVVFSSIAGFLSLSFAKEMLFTPGFIVGLGSLLGVYIGIRLKNIVAIKNFKLLILGLYFVIASSMLLKQISF